MWLIPTSSQCTPYRLEHRLEAKVTRMGYSIKEAISTSWLVFLCGSSYAREMHLVPTLPSPDLLSFVPLLGHLGQRLEVRGIKSIYFIHEVLASALGS